MGGLRVLPDLVLSTLEPAMSAMLMLPGGVSWDQGLNTEAVEKARAFLAAGCRWRRFAGPLLAASAAGCWMSWRHTSNALRAGSAAIATWGHYVENPAVTDGELITASGVAPIEFAPTRSSNGLNFVREKRFSKRGTVSSNRRSGALRGSV